MFVTQRLDVHTLILVVTLSHYVRTLLCVSIGFEVHPQTEQPVHYDVIAAGTL